MRLTTPRVFCTLFVFFAVAAPPPLAYADAQSRAQDDLEDARSGEKDLARQLTQCKVALAKASGDSDDCDGRRQDFLTQSPNESKWTTDQKSQYSLLNSECRRKRDAQAAAKSKCDDLTSQDADAKSDLKDQQRKLERLQDQADQADKKTADKADPNQGPNQNSNCVNCDKQKDKYASKSGWESFADVVKAVTPLGLGAMNTYGAMKAANLESSDYQTYASSMSAAGLPFSPNTSGYSSIMSAMSSNNSMLSLMSGMNSGGLNGQFGSVGSNMMGGSGMMGMGSMGMGSSMGGYGSMMGGYGSMGMGMGMGMGSSMGSYGSMMGGYGSMGMGMGSSMGGYGSMMGGYGSYGMPSMSSLGTYGYGSYGASPYLGATSAYGSAYSPWYSSYASSLGSTGLNSYYTNQGSSYAAQLRASEQGAVSAQDSLAAQSALYSAETRYQQVLGGLSGSSYSSSSYSPYSTGYYGSGYGTTSYGATSPYYTGYGTSTSVPALNEVRQ